MMPVYEVQITEPDGSQWSFAMLADLVEASSSIHVADYPVPPAPEPYDPDEDPWDCSPYQTADATHDELDAARLAYQWWTREDLAATPWDELDVVVFVLCDGKEDR